ncbi:MAG: hypothetical protein IE883_06125 [Epsilonproteobacteria bacterium]|nr:hypothetical protein [Campylobacterota bacterium]
MPQACASRPRLVKAKRELAMQDLQTRAGQNGQIGSNANSIETVTNQLRKTAFNLEKGGRNSKENSNPRHCEKSKNATPAHLAKSGNLKGNENRNCKSGAKPNAKKGKKRKEQSNPAQRKRRQKWRLAQADQVIT